MKRRLETDVLESQAITTHMSMPAWFAAAAALVFPTLAAAAIQVTPGTALGSYFLAGRIATPTEVIDGELAISGDTIVCVAANCTQPGGATRIKVTDGYILPGFVDAHNHVAYNVFPKWQPPKLYQNRGQWEASSAYKTFKAPYNTLKAKVFCEMVKYGEVRALLSGVTTIQGTAPNSTCFRTLVRNAENQNQLGLPASTIRTYILDISTFKGSVNWTTTKAYVIHLAEGLPTDAKSRGEFATLKAKHLLHAGTVLIHGTALQASEFDQLAALHIPIIWSPQSNLALYGQTTDIATARQHGVQISLGVDWNPTGSDNMFDELRVAAQLNQDKFASTIHPDEWLSLITSQPARALALDGKIGALAVNHKADITIVSKLDADLNRSLLKTHPQNVELVMVGGRPLYGDATAMGALRPVDCEAIEVAGAHQRVCVKDPQAGVAKSDQTLADITAALKAHYAGLAPLSP
jgi:5-methylthioadenosine/S-adenosylhomocysteine deaminase